MSSATQELEAHLHRDPFTIKSQVIRFPEISPKGDEKPKASGKKINGKYVRPQSDLSFLGQLKDTDSSEQILKDSLPNVLRQLGIELGEDDLLKRGGLQKLSSRIENASIPQRCSMSVEKFFWSQFKVYVQTALTSFEDEHEDNLPLIPNIPDTISSRDLTNELTSIIREQDVAHVKAEAEFKKKLNAECTKLENEERKK